MTIFFPSGETRDEALSSCLWNLSRTDPALAVRNAFDLLSPDRRQQQLPALIRSWAESAPKEAAAFVLALPAGQNLCDGAMVFVTQ